MPLTTVPITARIYNAEGTAVPGAVLTFLLSSHQSDGGLVVPSKITATTGEDGSVVVDLWPNSRGDASSTYAVRVGSVAAFNMAARSFTIYVGTEAAADLDDLIVDDADSRPLAGPVTGFNGRSGAISLSGSDLRGAGGLLWNTETGVLGPDGTNSLVLSGSRALSGALVSYIRATNTGPNNGYGWRRGYVSSAYGSGFDLGDALIARFERDSAANSGGQGMAQWIVAMSPRITDTSCSHRTCIAEWNVVNRGADTGFQSRRSNTLQSSVFLQIVPEAQNFSGQADPGTPKNVTAGFVFCNAPPSAEATAIGYRPRIYVPILAEPNSTHQEGRFIHASGSDGTGGPGGGPPVAFAQTAEAWQSGYRTDTATFSVDPVVHGLGQGTTWLDGSGNVAHRRYVPVGGCVIEHGPGDGTLGSPARWILRRNVSNPVNVDLTTDGNAANAGNILLVPNAGAVRVTASVVARSGTPLVAGWGVTATLARNSSAEDVTILASNVVKDTGTDATDWTLALTQDDTNGAIRFKVTGTGDFTISAVADVVQIGLPF